VQQKLDRLTVTKNKKKEQWGDYMTMIRTAVGQEKAKFAEDIAKISENITEAEQELTTLQVTIRQAAAKTTTPKPSDMEDDEDEAADPNDWLNDMLEPPAEDAEEEVAHRAWEKAAAAMRLAMAQPGTMLQPQRATMYAAETPSRTTRSGPYNASPALRQEGGQMGFELNKEKTTNSAATLEDSNAGNRPVLQPFGKRPPTEQGADGKPRKSVKEQGKDTGAVRPPDKDKAIETRLEGKRRVLEEVDSAEQDPYQPGTQHFKILDDDAEECEGLRGLS
jgi:hypothetical protein